MIPVLYALAFFRGDFDLVSYLIRIVVLFLTISVHECAHAYSAYRFGDDTAALQGRITLNPIAHLEPMGLVLMLLGAPIAWAKPVPVNPYRFDARYDMRKAMLVVSLSGIITNFLLAFLTSFLSVGLFSWVMFVPSVMEYSFFEVLLRFSQQLFSTNIYIGIFNLLPIPPLDGFELVTYFGPPRLVEWMERNARVLNTLLFIVIIVFNRQFGAFLSFLARPLVTALSFPAKKFFELVANLV